MQLDFFNMDTDTIASGKTGDGKRYLELFLQEYSRIFSETLNPGCGKCLKNYHQKYKGYIMKTQNPNPCQYRLKKKFENIPLEFGSAIFVNNENITDEYAEQLLARENGADLFEFIPKKKKESAEPVKSKPGRKPKEVKAETEQKETEEQQPEE